MPGPIPQTTASNASDFAHASADATVHALTSPSKQGADRNGDLEQSPALLQRPDGVRERHGQRAPGSWT